MKHIKIPMQVKEQVVSYCSINRLSISHVTRMLFTKFANGEIEIPFKSVPPNNDGDFVLNIDAEILEKVKKQNENSLQRTDRWIFCRLWEMLINKEITL